MKHGLKLQRGFTLVTTIFLLVVVSAMGAYLVQLATVQHISSAMSVSGASARYALTSGLEWILFELNRTGACPVLPAGVSVDAFQVNVVACNAHPITEGVNSYQLFDVILNAERGSYGSVDFTSVQMRASVSI